jgi:phosphoglucomutase|tara:strand:- start:436 stop:2538 length:2103 start_codon:yes stop_codon:yes gene_type:complete
MVKKYEMFEPFQRNYIEKKIIKFLTEKFSNFHYISNNNKKKYIKSLSIDTASNIEKWLSCDIPMGFRNTILRSMKNNEWYEILESFNNEIFYGTSSIRAKMVCSLESNQTLKDLKKLSSSSFCDDVLQGTNTFNPVTLLIFAIGLANHSKKSRYKRIVIGYDNRIQSKSFATMLCDFFLTFGFRTYLFDHMCSSPELVFSIKKLGADLGVMITASHNDKRFNGIKVFTKFGGQPTYKEKNQIVHAIGNNYKRNLELISNFLKTREQEKHKLHSNHIRINSEEISTKYIEYLFNFISDIPIVKKNSKKLKIGFCSINGTGYKPASKLLKKLGISPLYIHSMIRPDPLFSSFKSNQTLEPSNSIVYQKIISEFVKEYGKKKLETLDAILFTDPDSDRIGMICQTPKNEQKVFGKYRFVTGNELWTVVIWFYLQNLFTKHNLSLNTKNNLFVVKSFVTSDSIKAVCKKFHIKCIDGNVGFSELTNLVQKNLKKNLVNIGKFEESNGFTIAGNPNFKSNILSHILEKDGFLGIVKIIELLVYAKSKNSTFLDILNQLYTKHEIGYFHNFRSQIPENGYFDSVFENPEKDQILLNVEKFTKIAERYSKTKTPLKLGNLSISKVKKYPIVKNMHNTQNKFPFEGIRFFFNSSENHLTIRSSSTESKIRLFIQLKIIPEGRNLLKTKCDAEKISKKIIRDFKKILQN